MSALATGLVAVGLFSVLVAWGSYIATIPRGTVPAKPTGTLAMQSGGVGLAVAGVIVAQQQGALSVVLAASACFAAMLGLFFLWLYGQRKVPAGDIQVAVGQPMLAFSAKTSSGADFHSDSLRGKRVLLKFFRGGW